MNTSPYICESWQGFIQYVMSVIGNGYYWFTPIIPANTLDQTKWEKADNRLINKFATHIQKDKRYQNKKKGLANYLYVRYGNIACVMRSPGEILKGTESEKFYDIRDTPLYIVISENITLKIYKSDLRDQFTVYIARESLRPIKAEFTELIEAQKINDIIYRFKMLNSLPAYHGINLQKEDVKKHILKHAKRCGLNINQDLLFINTKRKIYDVFAPITQGCKVVIKNKKGANK